MAVGTSLVASVATNTSCFLFSTPGIGSGYDASLVSDGASADQEFIELVEELERYVVAEDGAVIFDTEEAEQESVPSDILEYGGVPIWGNWCGPGHGETQGRRGLGVFQSLRVQPVEVMTMTKATRTRRGKRKQVSLVIGLCLAVLSIVSVVSLIDFSGDGDPAGLVRIVLPVVFAADSSLSFLVGGYLASVLIAGLGSIGFSVALLFLATLLPGP